MRILYPLENIKIIQPFGLDNSDHPTKKEYYKVFDNLHPGIDFDASIGTKVYASFDGIVVRNEWHMGMGNVIGIRNGNIVSLYAHLSISYAKLGQIVKAKDLIALSGDTSEVCERIPHLHFELRDISKLPLKAMVFDPPFNNDVIQYKTTFIYKVNNTNTKKTIKVLSIAYFGNEIYYNKIKKANNLKVPINKILHQDLEVTIPNYT